MFDLGACEYCWDESATCFNDDGEALCGDCFHDWYLEEQEPMMDSDWDGESDDDC